MHKLTQDVAETIAISGFQYLAADDDLLMRFSGVTGILVNDMRAAASQQHFLVGVLDFFLSHEPDLLAWTESAQINPESIISARYTLAPEDISGF